MNPSSFVHRVRSGALATVLGVLLFTPAAMAQTAGSVSLTAKISDTGSGPDHWTVLWVTNASTGAFVRTIRKQGPAYGNHWNSHCSTWYAAVAATSANYTVAVDGFTSATATTYSAPNSPFTQTWNCKDASGNTVPDGTYKMWIQYAEDAGQGPVTTSGLLWTKGPAASTVNPANQGVNFTNMSIVWTPATVTPLPVIAVEQPAGSGLTSGVSTVNFGSSLVGTAVPLTFTVRNTGTASLTGIAVSKDGTNSADYTVTASPAATLAAGASTTFTVAFNPAAGGTRTAALHIASNDATRNPFNIAVTGNGSSVGVTVPDIALEQPQGTLLASGETRSFPSVALRKKAKMTFTLRNTLVGRDLGSAANLSITSVVLSGPNGDEFHLSAPSSLRSLKPGKHKTFKVEFAPQSEGHKEALLTIYSNDPDESPYYVRLLATTPNSDDDDHSPANRLAASVVQETAANVVAPEVASADIIPQSTQGMMAALPENASVKSANVRPPDDFAQAGFYKLLEYAFSSDPARAAAADAMPQQVLTTVDGLVYPALNFRRLKSADMLIYKVEESTDLIHWQSVPMPWQLADTIIDQGDGYEWLTVLASAPLPADGQLFMRVRVELGP